MNLSLINQNYLIKKKIGAGSFGEIYLAISNRDNEYVAVKVESLRSAHPQLAYEAKVYKAISPSPGIPKIKYFGTEGDNEVLVMELLGPSLEDLFSKCRRKWSLKTILLIVEQSLSRVAYVHSKGFIHRDIKPDNILMGNKDNDHQLFIIDFGLAKRFWDPRTNRHIMFRENKNLTGTPRYASINTHRGQEQSRRDDLESLAYIFIYFFKGSLPWQGIQAATKEERYQKILEKKQSISPELLCEGLPTPFCTFLKYTQQLSFESEPDYLYTRKLFRNLFLQQGYSHDFEYDWTEPASANHSRRIVLQKQEPAKVGHSQQMLREEEMMRQREMRSQNIILQQVPKNTTYMPSHLDPVKVSYPYRMDPSQFNVHSNVVPPANYTSKYKRTYNADIERIT